MNGEAPVELRTTSSPIKAKESKIGISHHFLFSTMNSMNSCTKVRGRSSPALSNSFLSFVSVIVAIKLLKVAGNCLEASVIAGYMLWFGFWLPICSGVLVNLESQCIATDQFKDHADREEYPQEY